MVYTPKLFLFSLFQVCFWQTIRMEWEVVIPKEIKALSGSCVVIPCTFSSALRRSTRKQSLTWFLVGMQYDTEVYNSEKSTNVQSNLRGRAILVGDLEHQNCSLQINNVTHAEKGRYRPSIDEESDSTVSVDVLDIPVKPTVNAPRVMTEGMPVMINCSVVHTCPFHPPTLAWDKIKHNTSIYHEDLLDGRWKTVLMLNYTPRAEHHLKTYWCSATYPNGKMSEAWDVFFIKFAPKDVFAVVVRNRTLKEGGTATLSCSCKGYPDKFTYAWYRNQQKEDVLSHQQTMTLRNISWASGPYTCTAQNEVGMGESPPLHLKIEHAPKGAHILPIGDVTEGEQMILSCETISSNPAVTRYRWYKNGNQIEKQREKTLKVMKLAMDNYGDYHCMAGNGIGWAFSETITIKATPGPPLFAILGGIAGIIVVILLALFFFIFIRNRRKKDLERTAQKYTPDVTGQQVENPKAIPLKDHLYGNIEDNIHVKDQHPSNSTQEYSELNEARHKEAEAMYSQAQGTDQQQQDPEGLHYSTIPHLQRPGTTRVETHPEDVVEYAAVRH
ncbi:B-cell receptor CD22-like [Ambystoma mexicanum]|uniref:B-cell receptor CD22-like n=1 Tax=Ambystoma mexicanum TaxID=8296 RepID=UPI0037E7325E